jgi:serine/threonine protein kinase/tetratricopeptide (TPR) repeat protein
MPADLKRARELFLHAVGQLPPGQWDAYVAQACGGDAALQRQVEHLLHVHREAGSFLEPPSDNALFLEAARLPSAAERAAYLDQACAGDPPRRAEVEALLRDHDAQQRLLDELRAVTATPDDLDACPGAVLGPYQLLQPIGEGGMGTVWLAQQTEPVKRLVALKLIKPGMDSRQVIARFEAERQALALMDHPHIAHVFDAGTTDAGRPYFVMELVKGVPITKYCDEHRLTPRQRLELFIPVCQALQHAHQKGIIHRDIKPSNVLIALYDRKPVPKVIDFGIAKATGPRLTEETLVTAVGALVGTLEYMSPEQAELNQLDIDTRSDIYSLGVLLYELLTGTTPLERKRVKEAAVLEVLRLIREEEPPKPSTRLSTTEKLPSIAAQRGLEPKQLSGLVRGELDWIVMKALDKDRNRRYETASGLALDVQRYLADEPLLAGPPSTAYRLRKFLRRNRGPVLAGCLVLFVLVGGIIGTTLGLVQAEGARQDAVAAQQAEANRAEGEKKARLEADQAANAERLAREKADQAATRERLEKEKAEKRLKQIEKGIGILASVFENLNPHALLDRETVPLRLLLGKNLGEAVRQLDGDAVGEPVVVARLQTWLGRSLWELGYYDQAEPVLTKARETLEASLGPDHLDTLSAKQGLAILYTQLGKYAQAEKLLHEVLVGHTAQLGARHRETVFTKQNLAAMYYQQGERARAEPLFQEVLADYNATLPAEDSHTLDAKHDLAFVYREQGKYAQAEKLYQEVLALRDARLGSKHPATLHVKHGLAVLYHAQEKDVEAEKLFQEVLALRTATLGTEHPDTLATKIRLASLYLSQDTYGPAETLYNEALAVGIINLGAEHRHILAIKNDLALLYYHQKKYPEAEKLCQQVLALRSAKWGKDHPTTLITKNNLALVFDAQGKYQQAEKLYKEVLAARIVKLGAAHPETLATEHDLALMYLEQGMTSQAETLLLKVVDGRTTTLGANHGHTLAAKNSLGELYLERKKYAKAERLLEEVVEGILAKRGAEHPNTLTSKNNLALVYHGLKKYAEAETLHKEVLAAQIAKLPPDHLDILRSKHNLAGVYEAQEKYPEAETLLKEVLAGRSAKLGADHLDTVTTKNNLAMLYWSMDKREQSVALLEEVVEQSQEKLKAGHPLAVLFLANLGCKYRDSGRLKDGIRCLEGALAAYRKMSGPPPADLAWIPLALAEAYQRVKDYARCEPLLREVVKQRRQEFGANDMQTAEALNMLGVSLLYQKKWADAEPVWRECLAILQLKQPKAWSTFTVKTQLGWALVSQEKYAEAEPLMLQGYEGAKLYAPPAQGRAAINLAVKGLIRIYEALGKKDEAAKWRMELETINKSDPPPKLSPK